ncbi:phosphotransferase [Fusibacter paucivorans]|uniref:Phosphotransferase n=1 Tax=Fusibacter paucivorans TaxID=76009 RepID=A0ABS5PP45_9FIRM|nr:aminoglycoside phosphotransferase family protein [Fusibacter paucivorans]MBS7526159.1 phosphotransferase [Fusibacter paucivorans]
MLTDTHDLETPLFTSRSSKIYAWEGTKLLKLFNDEVDPNLIENEKRNTVEAYTKGVTRVQCYGKITIGTQEGIIIECVKGKTLISLAGTKPAMVFKVPKLMAELQQSLHATHTTVIRSYKEMVFSALDSSYLSFLTLAERQNVIEIISQLPDGDSILHLDYHPDNIMSDGETATIIDWMTAARGVPAADVAATQYLLSEGEMIPGLNKAVRFTLEAIRKQICKYYMKAYKTATGMTDEEIAKWRLPFLIVRLGVWHIDSEIEVLQHKIKDAIHRSMKG